MTLLTTDSGKLNSNSFFSKYTICPNLKDLNFLDLIKLITNLSKILKTSEVLLLNNSLNVIYDANVFFDSSI